MEFIKRVGRSAVLGLIAYIALRLVQMPESAQLALAGIVFLMALIDHLLRWAGMIAVFLALWGAGHLAGVLPAAPASPSSIAHEFKYRP